MKRLYVSRCLFGCAALMVLSLVACTHCGRSPQTQHASDEKRQQREEKIREKVADATERAKPTLQKAGKKLGEAAKVLAQGAEATAEGVREGWNRNEHPLVELNSAAESELLKLPGMTRREAQRIIASRPYQTKRELVAKGILSQARYQKIRDRLTIK
jgi:DNA uptake protein ComE-like DNA-binding protein